MSGLWDFPFLQEWALSVFCWLILVSHCLLPWVPVGLMDRSHYLESKHQFSLLWKSLKFPYLQRSSYCGRYLGSNFIISQEHQKRYHFYFIFCKKKNQSYPKRVLYSKGIILNAFEKSNLILFYILVHSRMMGVISSAQLSVSSHIGYPAAGPTQTSLRQPPMVHSPSPGPQVLSHLMFLVLTCSASSHFTPHNMFHFIPTSVPHLGPACFSGVPPPPLSPPSFSSSCPAFRFPEHT